MLQQKRCSPKHGSCPTWRRSESVFESSQRRRKTMATQAKSTTTPETIPVTVENFIRAETDMYFGKKAAAGAKDEDLRK
jgi:hypothetical protein